MVNLLLCKIKYNNRCHLVHQQQLVELMQQQKQQQLMSGLYMLVKLTMKQHRKSYKHTFTAVE
jgi:hypothetical protein